MVSRSMRIYVGVLVALSAAASVAVLSGRDLPVPWPLLALSLLSMALSSMAIELPMSVSLSLAFAPIFAGIVYAGPTGGALLGAASAVSLQEIREHKPLVLMIGNAAQLALAGLLAGVALELLGAGPTQYGPTGLGSTWSSIVGPVSAMLVFYLVNLTAVGIAVSLQSRMSAAETVRALGPASYWVSLVVLALLGYVMARLMVEESWTGVLLLILPFLAARRTFRVFAELSEAYTSTVRSLVTAIEAKDPYTRGHSERVAVYARRLGERLALSRPQLDLLERAALLHDVGKIGIELDTLSSPMQLTAEEVRLIRRHPALGSELVGDVEFLADTAPAIRHHHERYDGAGYPDGLAAEDIPLLARLMAVADSYDAMTSNRAYRPAMTRQEALTEIERVAGTQLDRRMALQFTAMLRDDDAEVDVRET